MEFEYNYPVWATQGGGLVKEVSDGFVFVERPNVEGLDVGDRMPEQWGIAAANKLAHEVR